MRVAIVVGFFDRVWTELEREYSAQIAEKTLILVKQAQPRPIPNISEIASRLSEASSRAQSILIITASLARYPWVPEKVQEMACAEENRIAGLTIRTEVQRHANDWQSIIKILNDFGLAPPSSVPVEVVRRALGKTRVLCVSMEGRTTIRAALQRAGFPESALDEFCIERVIPAGKNPNLLSSISAESSTCAHLLYAWHGLRTLSPTVKKRFKGKQYESATAAQVAEAFKRWVLKFRST